MRHVGIDFGTTNSAIALVSDDVASTGRVTPTNQSAQLVRFPRFDKPGEASTTFRSILYFDRASLDARGRPVPFAGPAAIDRYLRSDGSGRLMQSLKSHVSSRTFLRTQVFGRVMTLEDLIASFLIRMREAAEAEVGPLGRRAVVGRPVRFVGAESEEDDEYAASRLRAALSQAGFDDVRFEYEPIGAAYHYESSLDHDELVLVADFGGGTSDFCLVRVGPKVRARGRRRDDVLGTDGVGLAGDAFDGAIVDRVVAPELGMRSRYRLPLDTGSAERTMEIPPWIYGKLRRWHHLSFLKSKETMSLLDELRKQALEPHKIEALMHVVEADLGFHLYRAVESTKIALSDHADTTLTFDDAPAVIRRAVDADQFRQWIEDPLGAIMASVDRLLGKTNVAAGDVDRVFMTGGTSLVPAVRRAFAHRFGELKLRTGDELTSIALGLALSARSEGAVS